VERASRRTRAGRCATGQQQGRCGLCGWCGLCFGGAQHSSLPSDEPSHPISDEITHASGVPAHPHVPAHLSVVRIIVTPPRETSGGVSVQPAGVPSSTRDPQPEADSPDDRARDSQRRQRRQLAKLKGHSAFELVVIQVPACRRRQKRPQHSPSATSPSVHGTAQRGTHKISSAVSLPSSEGSVPLNWLLSKFLRAAAKSVLSTLVPPPPPSVHTATSQRDTYNNSSAVSLPSSEGSVPLNWLSSKFLRAAAATSSAQSSRRRLSQSMAPHRGALTINTQTRARPAVKGACRETGCVP
jgi:hypothetical protein